MLLIISILVSTYLSTATRTQLNSGDASKRPTKLVPHGFIRTNILILQNNFSLSLVLIFYCYSDDFFNVFFYILNSYCSCISWQEQDYICWTWIIASRVPWQHAWTTSIKFTLSIFIFCSICYKIKNLQNTYLSHVPYSGTPWDIYFLISLE